MNILFISPISVRETAFNGSTLIIKNLFSELSHSHSIDILSIDDLCNEDHLISSSTWYLKLIRSIIRLSLPKSYILPPCFFSISLSRILDKYEKIVVFREDMMPLLLKAAFIDSQKLIFYPIDYFPRLYQSLACSSTLLPRTYYVSQQIKSLLAYKIYSLFRIPTIFVSSVDARSAIKHTGLDCIYTIPNGLSIEPKLGFTSAVPDPNVYNILFSGDFGYKPNLQACNYIISKIFPNLPDTTSPITIYLAGRGLEPKNIHGCKGSKHKLVITGEVDSLTDYYLSANLYISPLFSGSGIKNKILSALHFGLPVLATSISLDGVDFAQSPIHYLECNSRHFSDWCQAIQLLIESPSLSRSLSEQGQLALADSYSWKNSAMLLERLLLV